MDALGLANKCSGNISVKKNGLIYISPSATSKENLTEEMIAVIDGDNKIIQG